MAYTSIRRFFPHGVEGEAMDSTWKEWESLDKAIAYAHRYAKGIRFAGVEIVDDDWNTVYEITSNQNVYDYRKETA